MPCGRFGELLVTFSGVAIASASLAYTPARQDADLAHGAGLYATYCERCHGSHGDDISCSGDMTPLAGVCKRPRVGLVATVTSSAYFARGRQFEGNDARDLTGYLCSLKGEKGFDAPELVCLPRLLQKHYASLQYYRIIDVREDLAYDKSHIPNAVHWPLRLSSDPPYGNSECEVRSTLGLLGVGPKTMIVVYDEVVSTRAALLWWSIMRVGHPSVAILDGGFRRWTDEGYFVTPRLTPLTPVQYNGAPTTEPQIPALETGYALLRLDRELPAPSLGTFNPAFTLVDGGLRTAAEIRSYLERCGLRLAGSYRLEGATSETPFLVYVLRLLGFAETEFDPARNLLHIGAQDRARVR